MSLNPTTYWNVSSGEKFAGLDPSDFTARPGSDLAYHTDIFIIAVLALAVLCRFPRAFARLTRASEWKNGYFFHHIRPSAPKPSIAVRRGPSQRSQRSAKTMVSDESDTVYDPTYLAYRERKGEPAPRNYPPHVAVCWPFLRSTVVFLRARVAPGFSIGQTLCLAVYFGVLAYCAFYKSSPFQDPVRAGFVAMSQLPIVFALATKNNLLGVLLGLGYEKLNFLHRFAGKMLVLAVNVHSVGYFYKWSAEGTFTQSIKLPMVVWGFVGLVCVDILYVFSTPFWRQRAYNVFLSSHFIGFGLLLPACWFHKPVMVPYVLATLAIYALDRLLRILKTRIKTATIRPIPELGLTRVEIPHLNAGWRAGQHVQLRVLSAGMGWTGWMEAHPFTIASCGTNIGVGGAQEGLVLMCKKAGDWTNDLFELAKVGGYSERGVQRDVKVMVEGPYGGPGHAIWASYSAAVFIVGGSGITFALSAIQELIQKDLDGASRVKAIELVWMVQDPASLTPLLPMFNMMIQQSDRAPLRICVYYTRAPNMTFHKDLMHPSMSLSPGRPRMSRILEDVITRTVGLGAGDKDRLGHTGMLVACCGPVGLSDDMVKAVGNVEKVRRNQVGGIEVHEEVFGW
ncbi:hypothetical protein PC9H_001981 [Pleurotus ostreatus]|uniref:ferric-chelate reductase (NADPH) n=1 Tax=Pleurotus ostreatus TaxID=5322 RepID=A0A8H7DMP2_PLEOS|nr:uncharacterized protein PC9H_001981 [Pleurotus ostreatus]KAF7419392.1 hypothetical protein PC9H_001981 [Pleurotus ostreatus]